MLFDICERSLYGLRAFRTDALFYLTLLVETILLAVSGPHVAPVQSIPVFVVNTAYNALHHLLWIMIRYFFYHDCVVHNPVVMVELFDSLPRFQ